MAIYTTFFVCAPEELQNGFPGWRLPLAQAVRREFRNPVTGELTAIETREPEWPEEAREPAERPYRAVSIKGRYEDYLEGRLPPFVSSCPHWAAKGLTEVELKPLLHATGATASFDRPIYAPPSWAAIVQDFPPDFTAKLAAADQNAVATRWAAEMSTPEHTHSVSGRKLKEGWTVTQALALLIPISELAAKAANGQRIYLLVEW